MGRIVTAAAAEVQQRAGRPLAVVLEQMTVKCCFLDVVVNRREQRVPVRQVVV
jgi:hypothetical protein